MLIHSDQYGGEIRSVCTKILETNVHESDRYQVGLTKIFFRAGLLASFEQYRTIRLNAVAVLVQKNFLRYMAEKKYKEKKEAVVKLQSIWRGILAKKKVEAMRREAAALLLQRTIRGYLQRERYASAKKTIIGLQSSKF